MVAYNKSARALI